MKEVNLPFLIADQIKNNKKDDFLVKMDIPKDLFTTRTGLGLDKYGKVYVNYITSDDKSGTIYCPYQLGDIVLLKSYGIGLNEVYLRIEDISTYYLGDWHWNITVEVVE